MKTLNTGRPRTCLPTICALGYTTGVIQNHTSKMIVSRYWVSR